MKELKMDQRVISEEEQIRPFGEIRSFGESDEGFEDLKM